MYIHARLLVTAFTIFVFGGLSTDVAVRCGVQRRQPQLDGTEMQPRPAVATASLMTAAVTTAENWLGAGRWSFGPVGAPNEPSGPGCDAHCAEEGDGSDGDVPLRRGGTAASRGPLHADHARKPIDTAMRSCALPRWLAAAILLLGVLALWASGRQAMCGAPELVPPNHVARVQRENDPTTASDSHQAQHEHHHEKKTSSENASQHHPHEVAHGRVAGAPSVT